MAVRSVESPLADLPHLAHAAYLTADRATEVYLTDIDPADLEPGADLTRLSGRIIQLHMIFEPGATSAGASGCGVIIRHIVLAGGAIGVYSGGGQLEPDGRPGKSTFSGRVKGATLKLTAMSGPFADRLGAATMEATFEAPLDAALSRRLSSRVNETLMRVRDVPVAPAD